MYRCDVVLGVDRTNDGELGGREREREEEKK